MRPIDADAIRARHISAARYFKGFKNGKEFTKLIGVLVKRIDEAPTLDYAPVRHGEWVTKPDGFIPAEICCSECGKRYNFFYKPNYCPNCGAKMDGGKKDD